jgi:hypothetical protein
MHCKNFIILLWAGIYIVGVTQLMGGTRKCNKYIPMGTDFTTATDKFQELSDMLGRHQVGSGRSRFSCGYASAEDTSYYG